MNYSELINAVLYDLNETTIAESAVGLSGTRGVQTTIKKDINRAIRDIDSEFVEVIVKDYSSRIKKAREKKELKQEDLAKQIAEKESVIHQLESSKLKPNFRLAKKLEVFLNINLIDSLNKNIEQKKDINFQDNALTIGDIISDEN